jgi:hypothetical protein
VEIIRTSRYESYRQFDISIEFTCDGYSLYPININNLRHLNYQQLRNWQSDTVFDNKIYGPTRQTWTSNIRCLCYMCSVLIKHARNWPSLWHCDRCQTTAPPNFRLHSAHGNTYTSVRTASSVTTDVLLFSISLSKLPKCYLSSLIRLPQLIFQVCMLPNLRRPHSTSWFFTRHSFI